MVDKQDIRKIIELYRNFGEELNHRVKEERCAHKFSQTLIDMIDNKRDFTDECVDYIFGKLSNEGQELEKL